LIRRIMEYDKRIKTKTFEEWKKEHNIKDFITIYDEETGITGKLWDGDKARDIDRWKEEEGLK
jgi:hypothetical protein